MEGRKLRIFIKEPKIRIIVMLPPFFTHPVRLEAARLFRFVMMCHIVSLDYWFRLFFPMVSQAVRFRNGVLAFTHIYCYYS